MDGAQALQQVAAEAPDLMLLDMNLPVMDGWTVARTLRAGSNPIPIIALTAHAMGRRPGQGAGGRCDDYHAKPVAFDQLLQQVDDALLKREEAEE